MTERAVYAGEPECNARSSWFDWCTEDRGHDLPHRDQEHCVEWFGAEKPKEVHRHV